jgi:hypothetical protein
MCGKLGYWDMSGQLGILGNIGKSSDIHWERQGNTYIMRTTTHDSKSRNITTKWGQLSTEMD